MLVEKIHHVAYRCKDAKETVEFYKQVLNMDLIGAIAEDQVPSTKAPDPYMHIFLDAGQRQHPRLLRAAELAADGPRPQHAGLDPAHRLPGQGHGRALEKPRRAPRPPASTSSVRPTTRSSSRSISAIRAAIASRSPPGRRRRNR